MTIFEAFKIKSGGILSDEDTTALMSFYGLNHSDEWNVNNTDMKCAFYRFLITQIDTNSNNSGVSSISEGGYSISFDKDEKAKKLYNLALESGCSSLIKEYSVLPIIENKSNIW